MLLPGQRIGQKICIPYEPPEVNRESGGKSCSSGKEIVLGNCSEKNEKGLGVGKKKKKMQCPHITGCTLENKIKMRHGLAREMPTISLKKVKNPHAMILGALVQQHWYLLLLHPGAFQGVWSKQTAKREKLATFRLRNRGQHSTPAH